MMTSKPIIYFDSFPLTLDLPETEHERLTQIVSLDQFRAEHGVSVDRAGTAQRRRRAVERSRHRVPYE